MEDWSKLDEENAVKYMANLEHCKKHSAADNAYFSAAQQARWNVADERLLPGRDDYGELTYTAKQGVKAACLGREDASATAIVQRAILQRLDRNRNYLVVVILILLYIASNIK